jgi:uncharacterized protein (TIGR04222 family)
VLIRIRLISASTLNQNQLAKVANGLSIFQLAYLCHHSKGVIDVAIVSLCYEGKMSVVGKKFEVHDTVAEDVGSDGELLRQSILSMAASGASLARIRHGCRTAVELIRRSLVAEKLLNSRWQMARRGMLIGGIMFLPMVIGVIRLRNGLVFERPVGFLIGLLLLNGVLGLGLCMSSGLNRRGRQVKRFQKRATPEPWRSAIARAGYSLEDRSRWNSVALQTLAVHGLHSADRTLEQSDSILLLQSDWQSHGGGGDSGGGSGCGGGCGGGGCGGCGG